MRYRDLDLHELLELDPAGGVLGYAGQRVLIWDAVALGSFRRELIESLGERVARALFVRFGFAHGYRIAENFHTAIPWSDEREWRIAGGWLAQLNGLMCVEPLDRVPGSTETPFAASYWRESWEAQQHLVHFGRSEHPVCWTLCGLASGYMSYANQQPVLCVEEQCVARGDKKCLMVANTEEGWGERFEEVAADFGAGAVSKALGNASEKYRATERGFGFLGSSMRPVGPSGSGEALVARSEAMGQVRALATRVCGVDSSVLLTGEGGVGKEHVARMIHEGSPRRGGPFVVVDCAALTPALLDSELFGHPRGAFAGADAERVGLLESAEGGTIYLDQVGDLPAALQVKLMRALSERQLRRTGEVEPRRIDVRVLAGDTRDLWPLVQRGSFRDDLYYRLKVVEIPIPPLRERPEDILPLARLFLTRGTERLGERRVRLSPAAADRLVRHAWPGNARELLNAIEHALAVRRGGRIEPGDLPEPLRGSEHDGSGAARTLDAVEREHILQTLEAHGGNRRRTAEALGIGTATLYRKLKRYQGCQGDGLH